MNDYLLFLSKVIEKSECKNYKLDDFVEEDLLNLTNAERKF